MRRGRPPLRYSVAITREGGSTKLHLNSRRAHVIAHLRAAGETGAHIAELARVFGPRVRGVLQKLQKVGWVRRLPTL